MGDAQGYVLVQQLSVLVLVKGSGVPITREPVNGSGRRGRTVLRQALESLVAATVAPVGEEFTPARDVHEHLDGALVGGYTTVAGWLPMEVDEILGAWSIAVDRTTEILDRDQHAAAR